MANEQNYTWRFDLKENAMTKDVKEDYVASVVTLHSMTVADIAQAIVAERTEYRADTIVNIANLIDEKIRQLVCQGNTVVTGTALYAPSITGVFMGKSGNFDPKVNACSVNIIPSQAMRAEVAKVTPTFSGYVKDLGGARIALVKDTTTGKTDGTITPGGIIEVTGTKIKSVNADGTGLGKVVFLNAETGEEAATVSTLAINDPSRLMFIAPATLEEGSYLLRIETYFSHSGSQLKEAREIDYAYPLSVGIGSTSPEDPDGGDDDDDDGKEEL